MRYRLNSVPIEQFNAAVRQLNVAKAENKALRARLETVEAETRERCALIAEMHDHRGEVARAIRNQEPRHD